MYKLTRVSTMIQRVIAIAAMVVTTVMDSIDSVLTEGDENRPPQQTGRSEVIGGKKEKGKERVPYVTHTVYSAMQS